VFFSIVVFKQLHSPSIEEMTSLDLVPYYITTTVVFAIGMIVVALLLVLAFREERTKRQHELAMAELSLKCKSCDQAMPKTALFCPNCGTKRES